MKDIHDLLIDQIDEHFGGVESIPESLHPFIHAINESLWQNEKSGHNGRRSVWDKEEFLLELYENTADGIVALDMECTIISANPAMENRHSHAMPLAGKKCHEVYFNSKAQCPQCPLDHVIRSGKPGIAVVQKANVNGGISGWIELHCFPIIDRDTGTVKGVVEYAKDISGKSASDEAIRKSEDLYRAVFENTGTAAIVIDADGTITLANSGFEKLSGFNREELEFVKQWTEFFSLSDLPQRMDLDDVPHFLPSEPLSYECKFVNRDGAVKTIINNLRTIPGTRNMVASVLDVTDTKRLQSQLIHAEKMEAIGALAGGIAHDFNNLLMSIQGYTSLMLLDNGLDSGTYSRLKGIEEHVKSGADLTRQLLGYAQGGKYQVKPINMNDVVDKTAVMFGRTKKEIAIHRSFQEDLWIVEADQGEIERVLLNLFVNAWQAMPGGGELYLDTKNINLDKKYVQPYSLPAGRYVRVSTTDTGTGMDSKTMSRIFEPFFTTKEMGRGTGLGLASAYGIIKGHGGIINVYSEKGKGSTFSIYLPASRKRKVTEEKTHHDQPLTGTECVLIIDDEPSILDIGKQILELLGYKVLIAKDGSEAIEIFRDKMSEIDIVILDMIMPHMGGGETFDMLKSLDPHVRVILSSGYSMTGEADEIVERGCKGFIQKPFTPIDLSKLLREVLDAK
jgi:two-component system, cell cycle sensor histidine kinase and response regulator CckA